MFFRRVFLPFSLGYFLSQLFRSCLAVVSADLVDSLSLDAWSMGFLTSAYFLAFALAQLPVGIALDRFGPRRTEAFLLLFAAAGAVIFAISESAAGLALGRGLIGFGVAACLMASFHAFILWAPAQRLPFLNGAVMSIGAAGSLMSTAPVEWALGFVGWRGLFWMFSIMTLAAGLFLFLTVPEKPPAEKREQLGEALRGVGRVFSSRFFWSVAPLSLAHQGAYLSIQSLWAGPWLRDVAELPRDDVAAHLLTLAVGMALGFLGLGLIAERLSKRGVSIITLWIVAALVFQGVQATLVFAWAASPGILWFLFGLFGAAGMLSYVILTRRFPVTMAGRVNTGVNVLVFSSAFAMQAGIGAIIRWQTPPGESFSPAGFQIAFAVVLLCQVASLVWLATTALWRVPARAPLA